MEVGFSECGIWPNPTFRKARLSGPIPGGYEIRMNAKEENLVCSRLTGCISVLIRAVKTEISNKQTLHESDPGRFIWRWHFPCNLKRDPMRKFAIIAMLLGMPLLSRAQTAQNSWGALNSLHVGQRIEIVDTHLKKHNGMFSSVTDEAI